MKNPFWSFRALTLACGLLLIAFRLSAQVKHMVVIGVDGLSPDGVLKAKSPVMRRLMKEGAWSLRARGVMPTSSSPNWASMIMGAGPLP